MEKLTNAHLYRIYGERVRLMSSRPDRSAFVDNPKSLFAVPTFVPIDAFGVGNSFEARFVDFLAQWLYARKTLGANPPIVDFVAFRELDSRHITTTSWFVITDINMLWQAAWDLLSMPRSYKSECEKKQLLAGISCSYLRSLLGLHCTRLLMNFVPIHKPLYFVFYLPSLFYIFVSSITLWGQS